MRSPSRPTARFKRLCDRLENDELPYAWYILSFLAIVTVRNFLEDFSDGHFAGAGAAGLFYVQTYVFYATAVLIFSLFLSVMTRRHLRGVSQLVMVGFVVLIPTPLIDLIASGGKGFDMSYLLPGTHDDITRRFFTFFGPLGERGVTIGQKCQIAVIILGAGGYVLLRTKSVAKAAVTAIASYGIVFALVASPFIIQLLVSPWEAVFRYSNRIMVQYLLLLATVGGMFALAYEWPAQVRAFLKDVRPTRLAHCLLLYVLGFVIAWKNGLTTTDAETILQIPLTFFAVLGACLYSIMTNNIVDLKIDRLTNAHRPLPSRTLSIATYERIARVTLLATFLLLLTTGLRSVLLTALFLANFFLYSMPPFRLKRIPFLSKIFIAMNLLVVTLLGFLAGGGQMTDFPVTLGAWIVFGFTAHFNAIDIKDYEGDKANGIPTLPVLLGQRDAKIIIALCSFTTYLLVPLLLRNVFLLPAAAVLGTVQMALILKKNYRDAHVFTGSAVALGMLLLYLLVRFPSALVTGGAV